MSQASNIAQAARPAQAVRRRKVVVRRPTGRKSQRTEADATGRVAACESSETATKMGETSMSYTDYWLFVRRRRQRRRGALTLEAMLVLPILLLTTIGVVQLATAMLIEQSVTHAAGVAAREAAKGATLDEVAGAVDQVLASHGLSLGGQATLVVEDPLRWTSPREVGQWPCDTQSLPAITEGEVRTTICVDIASRPFLNALRGFGLDVTGKSFATSTVLPRN